LIYLLKKQLSQDLLTRFFFTQSFIQFSGNILISGQRIQRKPLFSVTVAAWLKLDTNRGQQSIFSTCNPDNQWNSRVQYSLTITDGRVKWFHKNEKSQVTSFVWPKI